MESAMITKKQVKKNPALKKAQKAARKHYGHVWKKGPKARLATIVSMEETAFADKTNLKNERRENQDLLQSLQQSGLSGLSGNGFLTADKLKSFQKYQGKEKILIINAAECDPGLVHDKWLLAHKRNQIEKGIALLTAYFEFKQVYLAAKERITESKTGTYSFFRVPDRYPMGHELQLIRTILGIELSKGEIPAEHGILVLNVQTVLAIEEIVNENKVWNSRYLTVANLENGEAKVVRASIGLDAKQLITSVLEQPDQTEIYLGGGALSCHKMEQDEQITAQTNYIAYGNQPDYSAAGKCAGCGACSANCPMRIPVSQIVKNVEQGKTTGLERFHPELCIGCSVCTYGCRAGKDIKGMMARINSSK